MHAPGPLQGPVDGRVIGPVQAAGLAGHGRSAHTAHGQRDAPLSWRQAAQTGDRMVEDREFSGAQRGQGIIAREGPRLFCSIHGLGGFAVDAGRGRVERRLDGQALDMFLVEAETAVQVLAPVLRQHDA